MSNDTELDITDLTKDPSFVLPEGRTLTERESELIKDWPESRKLYYRLCIEAGDPLSIKPEDLKEVSRLASIENRTIRTVSPAAKSDWIESIDYEILWNSFPKREMSEEGHIPGINIARQIIDNIDDFNAVYQAIKKYAKSTKKTEKQYIRRFDNFLSNLQTYGIELKKKPEQTGKKRIRRYDWVKPYRPLMPWEPSTNDGQYVKNKKKEMARKLLPEKKREIEEREKIKDGFYDESNNKWWCDE